VVKGVNAGVDLFMVPDTWQRFVADLTRAVEEGRVPMARIDDAVRRILRVKVAYGLFERPRPAERPWSNSESFGSPAHRAVAREAVQKSLVLLQHRDDVLPLNAGARILVAGKNADNRGHQCGGFTVAWQGSDGNEAIEGGTSIWEGIAALAPGAVLDVDAGTVETDAFDVAVVVIGETPYAEGMGDIRPADTPVARGSGPESLPRAKLVPYAQSQVHAVNHPEDLALIERIAARGIPVVVVFVSGRPLVVDAELEHASAFVAAWLPGSEGGGVADVLFGHAPFHGRTSFTWPGSDGVRFPRGHGRTLGRATA
jgi:beta-glucosidase